MMIMIMMMMGVVVVVSRRKERGISLGVSVTHSETEVHMSDYAWFRWKAMSSLPDCASCSFVWLELSFICRVSFETAQTSRED